MRKAAPCELISFVQMSKAGWLSTGHMSFCIPGAYSSASQGLGPLSCLAGRRLTGGHLTVSATFPLNVNGIKSGPAIIFGPKTRLKGEGAEEEEDQAAGKQQRRRHIPNGRGLLGFKEESPQVLYLFHIHSLFGGPGEEPGVPHHQEAVTQWCLGHCSLLFFLTAQRADWVLFCLLSFCHPPPYSMGSMGKKCGCWWGEGEQMKLQSRSLHDMQLRKSTNGS